MYCGKCGKEMSTDKNFCTACGAPVNGTVSNARPVYVMADKSEGLAIVLSFLLTGLGHLYVGKIAEGLILMIVQIAIGAVGFFLVLPLMAASASGLAGVLSVLAVIGIASFAIWVYGMIDSYNSAKEYNEFLRIHGTKPW